jgi:peptide/nickel transport system substrate-binding protein
MVKKTLTILVFCMVVILIITGCGTSTSSTTTSNASTTTTSAAPPASTSTTASTTKTSAAPTSSAATTTATKPAAGTPVYGGTLRYVSGYSPSMNCGWPLDNDWSGIWLINFIYAEPLVFYRINGNVDPMLAESWDYSPDHTVITFHLRHGVKFHDGSDFTADAVKFMFESNIEAKTAASANWKAIDIVDPYTVKLTLVAYTNSLWSDLATKNCQIIAPGPVRAKGKEYARENPVGTGPFKYVSFKRDTNAVFEKNPNYWKAGQPYVDKLEFVFVKEGMTQLAYMQSGDGQILTNQFGRDLANMQKQGFQTFAYAAGTDFLTPDSAKPGSVFKDKKVREAMEYAIDKKTICEGLGYGYMEPNNQLTPPKHPYYTPNLTDRAYNPDTAKKLLADAGFPNGFKTTISTQSLWKDEALAVQEYLKAVNIDARVDVLDGLKWWDLAQNGWDGLLFAGFSFGPNFASSFKFQFPPYAKTNINLLMPDGIKDLIDQALVATDPVKQADLNKQIVKKFVDDATITCVLSNAIGYVVAPNVHDGHFLEGDAWQYWNPATIWLSK